MYNLPYSYSEHILTPPPDMSEALQLPALVDFKQEHFSHHGNQAPSKSASRAPYYPQEVTNANFGRLTSQQAVMDDSQLYPQHRRAVQAPSIAPSFQIPKTVNDSGGSLSELAAQITCLFWFESSDLLQQIEDSPMSSQSPKPLIADAKPSTGFRKWVTTILSTTLVAQNVVLLALLFIHRLKKLNPTVRGKPGSEYRLLTVALMLGNKFLDDNTYTNKTWAEVSGINVNEVHIMEVEFLSNMKYCLFTSADAWAKWQTLLGKFASFVERASRPPPANPQAPLLPPASSLYRPMALPSPPASNQASPPYMADLAPNPSAYATQYGLTPAPSPMAYVANGQTNVPNSRKRSREDHAMEPAAKRIATDYQNYSSPQYYGSVPAPPSQTLPNSRATLPSLPAVSQSNARGVQEPVYPMQQLPPLNMPARAMAMVYPNASTQSQMQQIPALAGPSQSQSQPQSQYQSRQHSPQILSATASPTRGMPHPVMRLQPLQVSPTYHLRQRDSPYRPVHHMSTLTYPPTTSALSNQPQNISYEQMYYQPLGKRIQQAQSGRLPYMAQNIWLDGNHQQSMTPVSNWPGFAGAHQQQQHLVRQQ